MDEFAGGAGSAGGRSGAKKGDSFLRGLCGRGLSRGDGGAADLRDGGVSPCKKRPASLNLNGEADAGSVGLTKSPASARCGRAPACDRSHAKRMSCRHRYDQHHVPGDDGRTLLMRTFQ